MTFPTQGRFGGAGRPPVAPVAAMPAATASEPDLPASAAAAMPADTEATPTDVSVIAPNVAAAPTTSDEPDPSETIDSNPPEHVGDAPEADAGPARNAKPETPPPAKPKRAQGRRTKKTAATDATTGQALVVIQDGHIKVSDPNVVIVDLDAASSGDVTATAIVIVGLWPQPGRQLQRPAKLWELLGS